MILHLVTLSITNKLINLVKTTRQGEALPIALFNLFLEAVLKYEKIYSYKIREMLLLYATVGKKEDKFKPLTSDTCSV